MCCNFFIESFAPIINAVDIKPNKPAKAVMGVPTIIPIPLRVRARPLVDKTADIPPVTVDAV